MRRRCLSIFFLFCGIFAVGARAENLPEPSGWVNDFAGVISPEYKDKLNALIGEVEAKTSSEIAVVTVESMAPYDEVSYVRMLFDKWKPGKKGKDNGVLILLAVKERRWRIETGYGVEGILPDGLCGEIGRQYMVPHFKQGQYAEGLYSGTARIAEVISEGKLNPVSGDYAREAQAGQLKSFGVIALAGLFILAAIPWKVFFILSGVIALVMIFVRAFSFLVFMPVVVAVLSVLRLIVRSGYFGSYGGYPYRYGGGGGFGGGGFGGFGGGGGGGGGAGGGF